MCKTITCIVMIHVLLHVFYMHLSSQPYTLLSAGQKKVMLCLCVSEEIILSPLTEELKEGCICTVKRFENNPAKVIAAGTKTEMNAKLNGLDDERNDDIEPPKKKLRVEGKENKTTPKAKPKRRPKNQVFAGHIGVWVWGGGGVYFTMYLWL